jgi:glycosyltransferase involved in cell wall biosynthesis
MLPACTIILPIYKTPDIRPAIQSILQQTYPHWVLLAGLDGPDEQVSTFLNDCADPRIKVVPFVHRGFIPTVNELAQMATTTYVARMDADDYCEPGRLEAQINFLDTHAEFAGVSTDYGFYSANHKKLVHINSVNNGSIHTLTEQERLTNSTRICDPSFVYRKSALEAVGYFGNDTDIELPLQLKLMRSSKLAKINYPYYFNSFNLSSHSKAPDLAILINRYRALLNNYTNLSESEKQAMIDQRLAGREKHFTIQRQKKIRIEMTAGNYRWLASFLWHNRDLLGNQEVLKQMLVHLWKGDENYMLWQ